MSPDTVFVSTEPPVAADADVAGDASARRPSRRRASRRASPLTVLTTASPEISPRTRTSPGDGVDLERAEPAGDLRVGRGGLDRDVRAVRDRRPHPQAVARRRTSRTRSRTSLSAIGDDDAVAVLADLDVREEPLVAVDGDVRLLAVGRLDLDVAGGNRDLEIERQWGVVRLLEHRHAAFSARLIRMPDLALGGDVSPVGADPPVGEARDVVVVREHSRLLSAAAVAGEAVAAR